jgi:hypothetical protein
MTHKCNTFFSKTAKKNYRRPKFFCSAIAGGGVQFALRSGKYCYAESPAYCCRADFRMADDTVPAISSLNAMTLAEHLSYVKNFSHSSHLSI